MGIKLLKDVRPGDVVASEIFGSNRALLCGKGTTLSADMIRNLQKHAVTAIEVDDDGSDDGRPALSDEARRAIHDAVAERFSTIERTTFTDGVQTAIVRAIEALPPPREPLSDAPEEPPASVKPVRVDVRTLTERIAEIPTISTVYERFASVIASGTASAANAARVIEEDQGLTLRVLRMARSAANARTVPVTTVSQAIVQLGFRAVQAIVLSSSTLTALQRFAGPAFEQLWRHAFAVATCARNLRLQLRSGEPEEAYTMGLVHDMGQLLLRSHYKEAYRDVAARLDVPGVTVSAAERAVFGLDHQQVGELIARRWRLPEPLVHAVRHHHDPERSREHFVDVVVVAIADALASAMGLGSDGARRLGWPSAACWEALRLSPADVESLCVRTLAEYREFDAFYGMMRERKKSTTAGAKRS